MRRLWPYRWILLRYVVVFIPVFLAIWLGAEWLMRNGPR
jgi:hypothetical protein